MPIWIFESAIIDLKINAQSVRIRSLLAAELHSQFTWEVAWTALAQFTCIMAVPRNNTFLLSNGTWAKYLDDYRFNIIARIYHIMVA